jgi:hypothetical protein
LLLRLQAVSPIKRNSSMTLSRSSTAQPDGEVVTERVVSVSV